MKVPRLPIHLIDEIISQSVILDHKEKSKKMMRQLFRKFKFPSEYLTCECCGELFCTSLPMFMHLRFIGDLDFQEKPVKGSNFSKIFDDYENFYLAYIPEDDYSDDYSDEIYEEEQAGRYDYL